MTKALYRRSFLPGLNRRLHSFSSRTRASNAGLHARGVGHFSTSPTTKRRTGPFEHADRDRKGFGRRSASIRTRAGRFTEVSGDHVATAECGNARHPHDDSGARFILSRYSATEMISRARVSQRMYFNERETSASFNRVTAENMAWCSRWHASKR